MFSLTQNYSRLTLLLFLAHFFFIKLVLTSCYTVFLSDFYTKTTLNDSIVAWFHIYWLNLSYLPCIFICLLLLVWLVVKRPTTMSLLVIVISFYLYITELEDFILFNSTVVFANTQTWLFNTLLTNLLNKYHPGVFYVSVICLILLAWGDNQFYNKSLKNTSFEPIKLLNSWWGTVVQFNLLALTLGSWWALQEGTWGGWWNWDPSETLGLLVTFTILLLLHVNVTKSSVLLWITTKKLSYYFFILSYFFIQLNFEIVSHNFSFKLFHFFNSNTTLIQFCVLTGAIAAYQIKEVVRYFQIVFHFWLPRQVTFIRQSSVNIYLTYVAFTPFMLLPLVSYLPIVNYFTWNFFNLTFFYQTQSFEWISFLIIVSIGYVFTSASKVSTVLTTGYSFGLMNFTYVYLYSPTKRLSLFHLVLVLFLVLNFTSLYSNYLVRESGSMLPNSSNLTEFFIDKRSNIILQDGVVERVLCWSDSHYNIMSTWNISGISNIFEVSDFLLYLTHSSLLNCYYTTIDWCTSNMFIELHNINNLFFFTCLLYFSLFYTWVYTSHAYKKFSCYNFNY